eukprot:9299651-Pyramimonas_sp.AAC.1
MDVLKARLLGQVTVSAASHINDEAGWICSSLGIFVGAKGHELNCTEVGPALIARMFSSQFKDQCIQKRVAKDLLARGLWWELCEQKMNSQKHGLTHVDKLSEAVSLWDPVHRGNVA